MIAEIRLQQYRSYLDQTFKLQPGVNVVVGSNASGKTNLLESIIVACRGGSYRAADADLIMHNKDWARVDLKTSTKQTRTIKITRGEKPTKEFVIEGKPQKRLNINNQIAVILFEPNHLMLLFGPPEMRRSYLDEILEQTKPDYKKTKSDYLRTLRQRNNLIKKEANPDEFFPWDVRLSHLGGIIAQSRAELASALDQRITETYCSLSKDKARINLNYLPSVPIDQYQSRMLKKLESNKELDSLRGFTTTGPHREDLEILVNNKPILSVASRGENRSVVVALKLMEIEIIHQQLSVFPLVLLDDVFSELDASRRAATTEYLVDYQTIITTTDLENYQNIRSKINHINLSS